MANNYVVCWYSAKGQLLTRAFATALLANEFYAMLLESGLLTVQQVIDMDEEVTRA